MWLRMPHWKRALRHPDVLLQFHSLPVGGRMQCPAESELQTRHDVSPKPLALPSWQGDTEWLSQPMPLNQLRDPLQPEPARVTACTRVPETDLHGEHSRPVAFATQVGLQAGLAFVRL